MTTHALDVLEFERVLERVAGRASSAAGRTHIRSLRPSSDALWIRQELRRVGAVRDLIEASENWALGPIPDLVDEVARLAVDGVVLEPEVIHRIGVLLATSRRLKDLLWSDSGELHFVAERLVSEPTLEREIERCVDDQGAVLDTASKELGRIRGKLRGAHARVVRKLEVFLGSVDDRYIVSDASVTIREGRYVIPIRREGKRDVGGIVHDESQTGATLFVEPPVAIEAMNALRDLERAQAREVRRVLGEISARIAREQAALVAALAALTEFDALHGRARTAAAWRGVEPEVGSDGEMVLRDARHPLLLEAADGPVVPFDLDLAAEEHCLVVSGPNTGGKSVFLKSVGLITALTQSGVIPPVGPGSRMPVFRSFFADIGDEQSIARNLSTFSAHLVNLSDIVSRADEDSLVLIDEMGTGTDPAEGAALSRAMLEELVRRGATTLVSSHLGELKHLDAEGSGVVNASLQFDPERMEPTYQLMKGRPGRSYGLAIARRLGFPASVLDRAEAHRADDAARLEELLERLERQERELEQRTHDLDMLRARTDRLRAELEQRERTVEDAERTAEERANEEARKLLLDARAEVEVAIRELRAAAEAGLDMDQAVTEARRRVEQAARRHRPGRSGKRRGVGHAAQPGDRVRIQHTGAIGDVVEVREGRAVVEAGAMRFELALGDLERLDAAQPARSTARRGRWTGPASEEVRLEVDLRGMRVDEVEPTLLRALDAAVLDELAELRIIHGKGTGALRQRVGEILGVDGRVRDFRAGGPGEGGGGVTVAIFGGGA